MLYNTMRPELIIQLLLFGALGAGLLLGSILIFHRARGEGHLIGTAVCLLCVACSSAALFVRTTAPTEQWRSATMALFYIFMAATFVAAGTALYCFFKRQQAQQRPITIDAFAMIDDCAMIFDGRGELAASNVHPEIETALARAMTLNELIGLLPDTAANLLLTQGTCQVRFADRYYFIRLAPVVGGGGERLGMLALWRDISREMQIKEELDAQNRRISEQSQQLIQELHIEEALLAQREKQAMADAIQAELTARMEDALRKIRAMQADAHKSLELQTQSHCEENLKCIAHELRAMLSEIRKFVYETKRETRR